MEQLTKFHLQRWWRFATPYQTLWTRFPSHMALTARQTYITCFHLHQSFLFWFALLLGQQSLPLAVSLTMQWEASPEFTPVLLITLKPSVCEFTVWICSVSLCLKTKPNRPWKSNMYKQILTPCSQFAYLHMDADLNKSCWPISSCLLECQIMGFCTD